MTAIQDGQCEAKREAKHIGIYFGIKTHLAEQKSLIATLDALMATLKGEAMPDTGKLAELSKAPQHQPSFVEVMDTLPAFISEASELTAVARRKINLLCELIL